MPDKNQGIIKRYRPDGWDALMPGLVQDCIKAGEIEIDEDTRLKTEAFIRHCINLGADTLLDKLRDYGIDAIVQGKSLKIIISKIAVPGRPQFIELPVSYIDKAGYAGPGKLSFIPADKEVFKIQPGNISGE
jgi:hypothetical protein